MVYDFIIIGAGAVGLSTAWKLALLHPQATILVLEKESAVSSHQTGHNSGVIHSGIYYKPGSKKAVNCNAGRVELVDFCQTHSVKHDVCGKIIVATKEAEFAGLDKIYNTGNKNGLTGIKYIDSKEIKEIEPFCVGVKGLWVPQTGIVDFVGVCKKLAELFVQVNPKNTLILNAEVTKITNANNEYTVYCKQQSYKGKYLITCAGLQSDRLAKMEGLKVQTPIVGFRGDYYDLTTTGLHKIRNLIYPVPNPAFPFLGVHFTRMVLGGVECGPNAVFTFKREGYAKTDFNLRDTLDALGFVGTWRLFAQHWQFGIAEMRRAFSKQLFLKQLQVLIPSLTLADLQPGRSGVRAMALNPDGSMVDDFVFARHQRSIHVINAPSPAATACLAIGTDIAQMANELITN